MARGEETAIKDIGFTFSWSHRFSQNYYQVEADIPKVVLADGRSESTLPLIGGGLAQSVIKISFLANPLSKTEKAWFAKFLGSDYPEGARSEKNLPAGRLLANVALRTSPGVAPYTLTGTYYHEVEWGGVPNNGKYHGYIVCKVFQNDSRTVVVELESNAMPPESNAALAEMFQSIIFSK